MLEIRNVEVFGLDRACLASGNPMTVGEINTTDKTLTTGESVWKRVKNLGSVKPSSGHDNFLKGIIVQLDVKYPQYWTPEAQRYHWLDIISSQSKMHRLTTAGSSDEFHSLFNKYVENEVIDIVKKYVVSYNMMQIIRPVTPEVETLKYETFMKALSNLPMGYEMWETLSTNYLQLKTIYTQRKGHKLKEDWGAFLDMCEKLPLFLELTGKAENK